MKISSFFVAAISALTITAHENDDAPDIVATAKAAGLTSLVDAITAAGLVQTVQGLMGDTVFAPTNEAFAPVGDVSKIPVDQLGNILKYHIIQGVVMSESLQRTCGTTAKTLQGADVKVSVNGDTISINDAKVVQADVEVKQGVVHVIDKVLMPPM